MPYKVAAIDIHKKVLMVVVAAVEFESRTFGTGAQERRHLVSWLKERQVHEVVMESTAQYWKPIWLDLEPHFAKLHLAQAAHAAVKSKRSHFEGVFRKFLPKLGYKGAIWVVAHRLARLIWKILHDGIQYREQGNELNPRAKQRRAQKLSQALRKLGYAVTLTPINPEPAIGSAG